MTWHSCIYTIKRWKYYESVKWPPYLIVPYLCCGKLLNIRLCTNCRRMSQSTVRISISNWFYHIIYYILVEVEWFWRFTYSEIRVLWVLWNDVIQIEICPQNYKQQKKHYTQGLKEAPSHREGEVFCEILVNDKTNSYGLGKWCTLRKDVWKNK